MVSRVSSLNNLVLWRNEHLDFPSNPTTNTLHPRKFLLFLPLLFDIESMSTSNLNAQFDDSEEDDDFNPQPADLSDAEDAGGNDDEDAEDQIRRDAARQKSRREASDDEDAVNKHGADGEDEGEGEDTAPRDEDEEEDEEDEEDEEITVRVE
jgi:hypothetical protein